MSKIAVIDTGTNSTRLLIAEAAGQTLNEVMRQTEITRLGQDVDGTGRLAEAAKERVRQCLIRYASAIGELGVQRVLIIATSSMRDAADGAEFLKSQAAAFGFESILLSGVLEAELSFTGAVIDTGQDVKTMMFDVGGGSTEIVLGCRGEIEFAHSLDIGCVRLREKFFKKDSSSMDELAAARRFIDAQLSTMPLREYLEGLQKTVAVAGTVTTLAAIDMGLEVYNRDLIHRHVLNRERVDRITADLAAMTTGQRMEMPVMEKGRADVIVAGSLIVSRLLEFSGVNEFAVSEYDILDGTVLAMSRGRL